MKIDRKRLLEVLDYNKDTGIFSWKVSLNRRVLAGSTAGSHDTHGYIQIGIDGRTYLAHQLAYLYVDGNVPAEIDHIDRVRNNNKWLNLRPLLHQENMQNLSMYNSNKSGTAGVWFSSYNERWYAQLTFGGEQKYLGCFKQKQEAIDARIAAEEEVKCS